MMNVVRKRSVTLVTPVTFSPIVKFQQNKKIKEGIKKGYKSNNGN